MMAEGMGMEEAPAAEEVSVAESVDLPRSIIGDQDVAEGDVIRLEVVAVDDENGVLKVRYAHPKEAEEETEAEPSIEGLAKAFD